MALDNGATPRAEQPIVRDVWVEKYRYGDEADLDATFERVIKALTKEESIGFTDTALDFARRRLICPAGRVLAGAGTDKRVTLINCFTSPYIQDSMRTHADRAGVGIMEALSVAAYAQQMGGGIGMDFSTIRPRHAVVKQTDSVSSGVLPFMDMWNAMCATITSAGSRRGAMMATLRCDHPDIEEFIEAKQTPGRLTNFNVSVLVTDKFIQAVGEGAQWDLVFEVPRADGEHPAEGVLPSGQKIYSYKVVPARELWDKITKATYVHAEPGIIFIDRINQQNNLSYCETIHTTNPCGEQLLPDSGACNLGHTNLAAMVEDPFTPDARFNFDMLANAVAIMVRLLDNVLDVTQWPTAEHAEEGRRKRRIGLGFTGLASALQQLCVPYGSDEAVEFTENVAKVQALTAYETSAMLAQKSGRGAFEAFEADAFCEAPFVRWVAPSDLRERIKKTGIRNGVLLSVAPTGTTSLVLGNVSSGIEPVFDHRYSRKVRNATGDLSREYQVYDYGYLKYCEEKGLDPNSDVDLPDYFVTAEDLTVEQHLKMAAAAQRWVDSAISKTINCPTSMSFDDFKAVYTQAYELGLKGCTTYRPDPRSGRGAILSSAEKPDGEVSVTINDGDQIIVDVGPEASYTVSAPDKIPMQDVVDGRRYQIKWPHEDCAYYVIITDVDDPAMPRGRRPFELFIATKSTRHEEWVKAFALMATAIFRREGDPSFIVNELRTVFSAKGGGWIPVAGKEGRHHVPSLVAAVGLKIEEHLRYLGMLDEAETLETEPLTSHAADLDRCEHCGAQQVVHQSGCSTCRACGHSDCG